MPQSVSGKPILQIGTNDDLGGVAFISFASGNVTGTPPTGAAAGILGIGVANTKSWSMALTAAAQGLPVSCDGKGTILSGTSWEELKQINFIVPQ